MNEKLEMFSLLVLDKNENIAGAIRISMTKNDIFFDLFEYLQEWGRIVDVTISGSHFRISKQLKNYQFIEKIDKMLNFFNSIVEARDLHVDVSSFDNLKGFLDFEEIYSINFAG